MSKSAPEPRLATIEDFLAIPDEDRFHELIDGEIIEKAEPSGEHGETQGAVVTALRWPFGRGSGGGRPGGWWFATEVEIVIREAPRRIVRPDVAGWRRDRHPGPPRGRLVRQRPDWVAEILSTARTRDQVDKKHVYHQAHVDHYWILDPEAAALFVYRWHPDGYLEVLAAKRGDAVRAEPFDAIELRVGALFGDDEDDGD